MPLLIYIYNMMGQLISKYEPVWQEVSVESLIRTQVTVKTYCFLFEIDLSTFRYRIFLFLNIGLYKVTVVDASLASENFLI